MNNINADHVCRINDCKTISKATVFASEKQQGTCVTKTQAFPVMKYDPLKVDNNF